MYAAIYPTNIRKGLTQEDVLSPEEIQKYERWAKMVQSAKGTTAGVVATGVLAITVANHLHNEAKINNAGPVPVSKADHVSAPKKVSPHTQIKSDIVYSDKTVYGEAVKKMGTLTKKEQTETEGSILRPVSSKKIVNIQTAGVVDTSKGKVFNPFVSYSVSNADAYAPEEGTIFEVKKNEIVIKHLKKSITYYSILKGVTSDLKAGDSVVKGQPLGKAEKQLSFAIAKSVDKGVYGDFIHPNQFVDTQGSNNYRYGSFEYYSKPPISVSKSLKGTKVEEMVKNAPAEVKDSDVLKGVVIENKEQAKLLTANKIFYTQGVLPIQAFQGGVATVSPQVRALEPLIRESAKKYGIENMTEFLLAMLQQESGGDKKVLATDPFQSSESKSGKVGTIQDQQESVEQGVKTFYLRLKQNNMFDPIGHGDVRSSTHEYNYGPAVGDIANEKEIGYSVKFMQEMSAKFAKKFGFKTNKDWRGESAYGDFTYVAKVLNYFTPATNWSELADAAKKEAEANLKPAPAPAPVPAKEPVIDTVDVSHHNAEYGLPLSFYQGVKQRGVKGVIVKTSQGTSFIDPAASTNIKNARSAGLIVSAYHYAIYTSTASAVAEADYFDQVLQKIGFDKNTDDYVAVDIEKNFGGISPTDLTAATNAFIEELHRLGYTKVDLYSGGEFYNSSLIPQKLVVDKPWLARYKSNGQLPNFSNGKGSWQWTDRHTFDGELAKYGGFDVSVDYAGKYTTPTEVAVKPTKPEETKPDEKKADDAKSSETETKKEETSVQSSSDDKQDVSEEKKTETKSNESVDSSEKKDEKSEDKIDEKAEQKKDEVEPSFLTAIFNFSGNND
jgi:GH25 family lysozyme M1 (1,4-beta-N-acetylmuramidase)